MKVPKEQIVSGIVSYVETKVIPKIEDVTIKVILSIGIKALEANTRIQSMFFSNQMIKALMYEDGDGLYETDEIFKFISESVKEYGPFPVEIQAIPFILKDPRELTFNVDDINELQKKIEKGG